MDFPDHDPALKPEEISTAAVDAPQASQKRYFQRMPKKAVWILAVLFTYLVGLGSGYGLWGGAAAGGEEKQSGEMDMNQLVDQVLPAEGYILPISFGDLGPQMVKSGVFDRDGFVQIYEQANQPLSNETLAMLDGTHTGSVVVNQANAYFLLNFLWALGLSNKNPVLDNGPIQQGGQDGIGSFASTGGWTLATRPVSEIFSNLGMIHLSKEQQLRVEEAAKAVFRPCCNNPTHFPDCNHGMAMLGLMELMASQEVSLKDMLAAAKAVNAFWYPQQTLEQAVYFVKSEEKSYSEVDPEVILGYQFSSRSGFANLHQQLGEKGWLPQAPSSGGSCGV